MKTELIASKSISIHAGVEKTWDALVNPVQIKKYLYGTDTKTDWKVGSPITFKGEWEGKSYEDKGTILAIEKEKLLKYSYWSSMAGTKDAPENYANVTFSLKKEDDNTKVSLTQDNNKTEDAKKHSEENWGKVLDALKKVLEQKKLTDD